MTAISLIVSTLGRTTQLDRLLVSLRSQMFNQFELIVVDQNSDDRLAPVLAPHRSMLNIVHTRSGRGVSRGRNAGLRLAKGTLIAFPDDDCWYPQNLLAGVCALFQADPALDLVSGRTVDAQFKDSLGVYAKTQRRISRRNIWRVGNSNTIFLRARPHLYFDESLGVGSSTPYQSGEETDFLLRLLDAGAELRFDPALLVHHDQIDMRGDAQGVQRARMYAPGQGRVLRLNRYGAHHALWLTFRPLARAAVATAGGDLALARYKLAWAQGLAAGYCATLPVSRPTLVSESSV